MDHRQTTSTILAFETTPTRESLFLSLSVSPSILLTISLFQIVSLLVVHIQKLGAFKGAVTTKTGLRLRDRMAKQLGTMSCQAIYFVIIDEKNLQPLRLSTFSHKSVCPFDNYLEIVNYVSVILDFISVSPKENTFELATLN